MRKGVPSNQYRIPSTSLARSLGSDLARLGSEFRQISPDSVKVPKNRVSNDKKKNVGKKIHKNYKKSRCWDASYSKKMQFFYCFSKCIPMTVTA